MPKYGINKRSESLTSSGPVCSRDGCTPDPCSAPYSYPNSLSYQCLYFTAAKQSFLAAKEACEQYGGFLPYTYTGYTGGTAPHSRPETRSPPLSSDIKTNVKGHPNTQPTRKILFPYIAYYGVSCLISGLDW